MRSRVGVAALGAALLSVGALWLTPGNHKGLAAAENDGVITGVVTSEKGPEAGVWVIAETTDTQTKFRKIVVTDDRGRYLLPDLPVKATFTIWTRGYGLVDSPTVRATPGRQLA